MAKKMLDTTLLSSHLTRKTELFQLHTSPTELLMLRNILLFTDKGICRVRMIFYNATQQQNMQTITTEGAFPLGTFRKSIYNCIPEARA